MKMCMFFWIYDSNVFTRADWMRKERERERERKTETERDGCRILLVKYIKATPLPTAGGLGC